MNSNKYLENIEIKNRRLLLKIYNRHVARLKYKIYLATENGNDTVYLERLRNEVEQEIALMQRNLQKYSAQSTKTSYNSGAKMAFVGVAAKELVSGYQFGGANREAMLVLAKTTYQPLSKMAQKIGRATLEYMKRENFKDTQTVLKALNQFVDSDFLRKTGIEGIADVAVGSSSWQKVAREIRDKIIKEGGLKVPYYKKDGTLARMVNAQDYAKMVARTTTSNIYREGAKDRILDTFDGKFDLVEILNHSEFPNSPCIPFEGKILSLTGVVEGYTTLAEAEEQGLFHPNCVHSFAFTDKVKEIYAKGDWEEGTKKEEKEGNNQEQGNIQTEEKAVEEKPIVNFKVFKNGEEANNSFYYDDEKKGLLAKKNSSYGLWQKSLSIDEKEAITAYAGTYYQDINDHLRGIVDLSTDKNIPLLIQDLDTTINKFNLKEDVTVFRGVNVDAIEKLLKENNVKNYTDLVGKTYKDNGYMSTSAISGIEQFGTKKIQMELQITKGVGKGAYINELSGFTNEEYEFLLKRGSNFDILEVTEDPIFGDIKFKMRLKD